MLLRVALVWLGLWLTACSSPPTDLVLPDKVSGGWARQSLRKLEPAEAPGSLPKLGVAQAFAARYDGPTTVDVQVFRMQSTAAAFEARQQWRADGQRIGYHHGDLFIVASSPQPGRAALEEFLKALEKTL